MSKRKLTADEITAYQAMADAAKQLKDAQKKADDLAMAEIKEFSKKAMEKCIRKQNPQDREWLMCLNIAESKANSLRRDRDMFLRQGEQDDADAFELCASVADDIADAILALRENDDAV